MDADESGGCVNGCLMPGIPDVPYVFLTLTRRTGSKGIRCVGGDKCDVGTCAAEISWRGRNLLDM